VEFGEFDVATNSFHYLRWSNSMSTTTFWNRWFNGAVLNAGSRRVLNRGVLVMLFVIAVGPVVNAVDLTWTGAASSLIYDNGTATGNWNPSVPTGLITNSENWIFPDATTLGLGSKTPSFDSGGIFN